MKTSNIPELKGGQMLTIAYIIAILIVLYVVYKVLASVGLIKTAAKKKELAAETEASKQLRAMKWFNPLTLNDYPDYVSDKTLTVNSAQAIRKAVRGWGTDEEAIYTAFGQFKNKLNIAETSLRYKAGYNLDMLDDLLNDLNDSERLTLIDIINKLPNT